MFFSFRPSLRTLLLSVNLIVLLLPVGAIYALHLYESELIRRTEASLISQGGLLVALFKKEILRSAGEGKIIPAGNQLDANSPFQSDKKYLLIRPQLDVADEKIFPPAPSGVVTDHSPDSSALIAGQVLEPILREAKRITLTGVRVVDYQGVVVASSGTENNLSLRGREEVELALKGKYAPLLRQRISDEPTPAYSSISRGSDFRVFVAMPVVDRGKILGAVVLSRSPISRGKGLYLIRSQLLRAASVIIVLVVLFSIFITFVISAPIKALIRQADRVRRGEQGAEDSLRYPGTSEVAHLSKSIVQMAKSLEARADYIKTFAGNVSHEFKTPLTSLKGTVELLRSYGSEMSGKEHETFLLNMEEDVDRLDRLVRRLLELARADVITPGTAMCDINTVFLSLNKRYRDTGKIEFSQSNELPKINMDQETLESIVVNMIENSLQHGGAGAHVTLSAKRNNNRVELLISDTGSGITEANRNKIFRRFFTTARHTGGSGLGLSIVQSLLAAHNGTIELLAKNKETTFKISLQYAPVGS